MLLLSTASQAWGQCSVDCLPLEAIPIAAIRTLLSLANVLHHIPYTLRTAYVDVRLVQHKHHIHYLHRIRVLSVLMCKSFQ